MSKEADAATAMKTSGEIAPMLAGHSTDWQSSVLADLLARWVARHHPDVRTDALEAHFELVIRLLPIAEHEMFGDAGHSRKKDDGT